MTTICGSQIAHAVMKMYGVKVQHYCKVNYAYILVRVYSYSQTASIAACVHLEVDFELLQQKVALQFCSFHVTHGQKIMRLL